MKVRFPLYAKILIWLFANVVFLALLGYGLFKFQFSAGLEALLAGRAGERIQTLSEVLRAELNEVTPSKWNPILERFGKAYGVKLILMHPSGTQVAGEPMTIPPEVRMRPVNPDAQRREQRREERRERRMAEKHHPSGTPGKVDRLDRGEPLGQPDRVEPPEFNEARGRGADRHLGGRKEWQHGEGSEGGDGRRPPEREEAKLLCPDSPVFIAAARPEKQVIHTKNPDFYWILSRYPIQEAGRPPRPYILAAVSPSLESSGLLFDFRLVLGTAGVALMLSALFWWPLVRGITRSISQVTKATGQIAEGQFEVRLSEQRRDEIGSLSLAINQMAARIAGLLNGQKRFLGDVAHELCSPIARTQLALGILEQKATQSQMPYLADLREEVQMMSDLVHELLSFSKASLVADKIELSPVCLLTVAQRAIDREGNGVAEFEVRIHESLQVLAEPQMLQRSVNNLVRNAIRYAGEAGPITLSASVAATTRQVALSISDCGSGVSDEELVKMFDPFYRSDPSRTRETGGIGLGLAIVRACVEACGGTVTGRNRKPSGLEVVITLDLAC